MRIIGFGIKKKINERYISGGTVFSSVQKLILKSYNSWKILYMPKSVNIMGPEI